MTRVAGTSEMPALLMMPATMMATATSIAFGAYYCSIVWNHNAVALSWLLLDKAAAGIVVLA
jgi:hypothetical protein